MHDEMLRSEGVIGGAMDQLLSSNDYFGEFVNLATDADSYIVGSDLDEFPTRIRDDGSCHYSLERSRFGGVMIMTLYMIDTQCPICKQMVKHVEAADEPINLMQEVPISGSYCRFCGARVKEWDVHEDAEIEHVLPTQKREANQ